MCPLHLHDHWTCPHWEYCQRFFPQLPTSCPCSKAEVQTHEHIVMECNTHDPSSWPCNIIINSFVHFLVNNPTAFSFDNGWGSYAVWLSWAKAQPLSPTFSSFFFFFSVSLLLFLLLHLSRYSVSTTACLRALCNKLLIFFFIKKKRPQDSHEAICMSSTATILGWKLNFLATWIHVPVLAFVHGSIPPTVDSFHWQTTMAIK